MIGALLMFFYCLVFEKELTAGEDGRLRGPLTVDEGNVSYESSAGQKNLDLALRWAHSVGDFDLGAYWFHRH